MEEDILNYSPTVMFCGTPSIYFACLSWCLSVCLYPINFKAAKPIKSNFFVGPPMTPGKVYRWSKLKKPGYIYRYSKKEPENCGIERRRLDLVKWK